MTIEAKLGQFQRPIMLRAVSSSVTIHIMPFQEILHSFNRADYGLDLFMYVLDDRVKEILGTDAAIDRDKLLRKWQLGYEKLKDVWTVVKGLPDTIRSDPRTSTRLILFHLGSNGIVSVAINMLKKSSQSNPDYNPLDDQIREYTRVDKKIAADIHEAVNRRLSGNTTMPRTSLAVWNEFVDRMIGSTSDFDQAMFETCTEDGKLNIHTFFMLASVNEQPDPKGNAVVLSADDEKPTVDLHIHRVSTNPFVQTVKTLRGLEWVRRSKPKEAGDKPVRGISWLLGEQTNHVSQLFRLDPTVEAQVFDLNTALKSDPPQPVPDFASVEELMVAAVSNVNASTSNLVRFLTEGTLPKIGGVMIPSSSFFLNS